jgi:hypothetical protein
VTGRSTQGHAGVVGAPWREQQRELPSKQYSSSLSCDQANAAAAV